MALIFKWLVDSQPFSFQELFVSVVSRSVKVTCCFMNNTAVIHPIVVFVLRVIQCSKEIDIVLTHFSVEL
eukprot:293985-Hanusia_phi.AAC.5